MYFALCVYVCVCVCVCLHLCVLVWGHKSTHTSAHTHTRYGVVRLFRSNITILRYLVQCTCGVVN